MRGTIFAPVLLLAAVALAACESCETGGSRPAEPVAEAPGVEAPGVEAATPAPEQAPKEGEADCFVIVDAEPDLGAPPLRVVFETEIDCTAGPVTYRWDFGDGAAGRNEANPIHVYEKAGDFIATVTVTAPDGGVGSDEIDITVDELLGD